MSVTSKAMAGKGQLLIPGTLNQRNFAALLESVTLDQSTCPGDHGCVYQMLTVTL